LYNGLLSGISLDGKSFFYVNPLEANGKFKFNSDSGIRQPWFDCSCCPTNLIRFIPSLPGLIYAVQNETLYVNIYASNKAEVNLKNGKVRIEQQTDYPWYGKIKVKIDPEKNEKFTLKFRLPGWMQNEVLSSDLYSYADSIDSKVLVTLNEKDIEYTTQKGYATITRIWNQGEEINISFPMNIRRVISNKKVKDNANMTALEYGPLVYCVEGIDNNNQLDNLTLPNNTVLNVESRSDLLNGVNIISGDVPAKNTQGTLKLTAIPYYAWSNRGAGTMKVWLPKK
jgi:DUF1680 family protein